MNKNEVIYILWTLAGVLTVVIALIRLGSTTPLMGTDSNYGVSMGVLLIVVLFIGYYSKGGK